MGKPSVHPMGTIIYKPEKCFNGYTIFQANEHGATLIDMNGGVVNHWQGLKGFPNKLLKGGYVFGSRGERNKTYGWQDQKDLIEVDWDGKVVWEFKKNQFIEDPGYESEWMARQHHDYQREGNPVGYYVPDMECQTHSGNTLMVTHTDVVKPEISLHTLISDRIIEVDWDGNIVWEWCVHDHFEELGFDEAAKNAIARNPNIVGNGQGDWMHINSMSVLGPNQWYDAGDERFHPDNIIWDARETNILAIISKETGKIVWKIGPDFTASRELRKIGQIIGQHHAHMIPKGLPGEGNILVFDNGGWAGYGAPCRTSKDGTKVDKRDYSRVIEIDPVTLKVVWEFTGNVWGGMIPSIGNTKFYSQLISSAQRLPNGNTMITEGSDCRMFEVTPDKEVVWEYYAPFNTYDGYVYRAYRCPYEYVPQLEKPEEVPVERVDNKYFRMPGAAEGMIQNEVTVTGTWGYEGKMDACVTEDALEGDDELSNPQF